MEDFGGSFFSKRLVGVLLLEGGGVSSSLSVIVSITLGFAFFFGLDAALFGGCLSDALFGTGLSLFLPAGFFVFVAVFLSLDFDPDAGDTLVVDFFAAAGVFSDFAEGFFAFAWVFVPSFFSTEDDVPSFDFSVIDRYEPCRNEMYAALTFLFSAVPFRLLSVRYC
jgi:hypothetical protein